MAKNVFTPREVVELTSRVYIEAPGGQGAETEDLETAEAEPIEEYEGPTADELRREAEAFKEQWEKEKEALVSATKLDAERIIKEAEASAFEEVKRKQNQAAKIK
jgi:flagellar assembly protein FliH